MKCQHVIRWLLIYGVFIIAATSSFPTKINAQAYAGISEKATQDMSLFYWLIAVIGGIIAITLSYVGYRKYKAEEKKRKEKEPKN